MDPITIALLVAGAYTAYRSAKDANKKNKGLSDAFPTYQGYRPPHVENLRPVEDLITKTVMRRSQGQDVGFDPARRNALLENYNIESGRDLEKQTSDIKNRLAGQGLSRNAAANDELLGRALRQADQEKKLYTNRIDIEDLAKANQERDVNTARLQDLNTFNFGQENEVADFDLDVFNSESGNERARRGFQSQESSLYQDPYASALEGGANAYLGGKYLSSPKMGQATTPTSTYSDYSVNPSGTNYKDATQMKYIDRALKNKNYNIYR